jgi:hypothetical protein
MDGSTAGLKAVERVVMRWSVLHLLVLELLHRRHWERYHACHHGTTQGRVLPRALLPHLQPRDRGARRHQSFCINNDRFNSASSTYLPAYDEDDYVRTPLQSPVSSSAVLPCRYVGEQWGINGSMRWGQWYSHCYFREQ